MADMKTYVTLDAGHEEFVSIPVGVLDKVGRGLLSRNGNKRHTFVRWLEPNNLGTFNGAPRFVTTITLPFSAFRLLFLLSSSRGRSQETEGS